MSQSLKKGEDAPKPLNCVGIGASAFFMCVHTNVGGKKVQSNSEASYVIDERV